MIKTYKDKNLCYWLWNSGYVPLFLFSCFFITVYSFVSTPLRPNYETDSTFFILLGKLFVEGKIPYVDYFDHKGPSLILIEAAAQLISSERIGLFILQIVNLFITLILIFKTSKLVLNNIQSYVVCVFFLVFIKYYYIMGNTTEEWSFIPNLICLYYLARVFFKKEILTSKQAFIMGVCFSFLLWLRINNAGTIVALCAFIFFYYLVEKKFQDLKRIIIYFLLGQIPFTVFYLSFFAYHGAIHELIYSTFLHNMLYVQKGTGFEINFREWANPLSIVLLPIATFAYYAKTKKKSIFFLMGLMLVIGLLGTNVGGRYPHYFLTISFNLTFALILIFVAVNSIKYLSHILCFLILIFAIRAFAYGAVSVVASKEWAEEEYLQKKTYYTSLLDTVPKENLNDVFFYSVSNEVYLLMNILPNYKYIALQDWHGVSDETIYKEINEMIFNTPPQWIAIEAEYEWVRDDGSYDFTKFQNKVLQDILEHNYIIEKDLGRTRLLKHKE